MLYVDLVEMVTYEIKRWVNIDHISINVENEQNNNEDNEPDDLLHSVERKGDKRDKIGGDVAHHLAITLLKIRQPLMRYSHVISAPADISQRQDKEAYSHAKDSH